MTATIQVRVDEELKTKSDQLFKELGTDTTTAIRMFLTQAVANNGFPFEIKKVQTTVPYRYMTEEELFSKLETSRKHAAEGNYRAADNMVAEIREKKHEELQKTR